MEASNQTAPAKARRKYTAPTSPRQFTERNERVISDIAVADALQALAQDVRELRREVMALVQPQQLGAGAALVADASAARLAAVLSMFTGKNAQQRLEEMLESSEGPTPEAVLRAADRIVARQHGRAA